MRAYLLPGFGEAAGLGIAPVPEPGVGEVRIRVETASVNPVDAAIGAGFFREMTPHRLPAVLGRDLAGTVEAVGSGVSLFQPGDPVFGVVKRDYIGDGTFADYVVVPEDRYVVRRPDGLPLDDAGALGLAGVTAWQCLEAIACTPGDTVFVNGATGGVGAFLLQLGRARDLQMIATARPGAEEEHVRGLGATETIDWTRGATAEAVRALAPAGVDGVVDLVSTNPTHFKAMDSLTTGAGRAASTLGAAAGATATNVHSNGDPVVLRRLAELVVDGTLVVPLVDSHGFEQISDAFRQLAAAPLGKVGLRMTR